MRKDIEIHINTGDITLNSTNRVILRDFSWIAQPENLEQRYLYGEVSLSANVLEDTIFQNGIFVAIPYTPIYKEIKLRIKRQYSDENYAYLRNPKDGSEWFVVTAALYGKNLRNIFASELMLVSEGSFYLTFESGNIRLFSADTSDVAIIKANWQNRNLLLKCVPGNCYRYPLIGVGLVRWTNSNISVSQLAQKLKEQFAEDGTPIIAAKYDFDNNQLYLNIDTSNVDNDA